MERERGKKVFEKNRLFFQKYGIFANNIGERRGCFQSSRANESSSTSTFFNTYPSSQKLQHLTTEFSKANLLELTRTATVFYHQRPNIHQTATKGILFDILTAFRFVGLIMVW
jgi:hypothetical protein